MIGAQKAGTTAIAAHIEQNGVARAGSRKEPNILNRPHLSDEALSNYVAGFGDPDVAMDATTLLSMRTAFPDAATNAKRLAERHEVTVLYLVRHPWTRLISQFYHLASRGLTKPSLVAALGEQTDLVLNSLYNFQIEPWVDAVGQSNILLISSENYFEQPTLYLQRIANHLGVPVAAEIADPPRVNTRNDTQTLRFSGLRSAYDSEFFQSRVRPFVPGWLSKKFRRRASTESLDESCPASLRMPIEAAMSKDLALLAERSQEWASETARYLSQASGDLRPSNGGS